MGMVSNCCTAHPWLDDTDICSSCKEHAEFYDEDIIQIDDLIEGQEYKVVEPLCIKDHDGFSYVTFPIGYILTYKGREKGELKFISKDGIEIGMDTFDMGSAIGELGWNYK